MKKVEDPVEEISLVNAKMIDSKYELDDIVNVEVNPKSSDVSQHRMQRT